MPLLEVHNGPLCERMTCLYTPDVSPDPIIYLYAFFLFFFRTPRRPGLARRKKKMLDSSLSIFHPGVIYR